VHNFQRTANCELRTAGPDRARRRCKQDARKTEGGDSKGRAGGGGRGRGGRELKEALQKDARKTGGGDSEGQAAAKRSAEQAAGGGTEAAAASPNRQKRLVYSRITSLPPPRLVYSRMQGFEG
jgi:hypothetical protein